MQMQTNSNVSTVALNPVEINFGIIHKLSQNGKGEFIFTPSEVNWQDGNYLAELCYRLIKGSRTDMMMSVANVIDNAQPINQIRFFQILLAVDYLLSSEMAANQYDKFIKMVIADQGEGRSNYSTHMADQGSDAMEKEILGLVASQQGHYCKSLFDRITLLRTIRPESINHFLSCQGYCGGKIPTVRIIAQRAANKCVKCKNGEQ